MVPRPRLRLRPRRRRQGSLLPSLRPRTAHDYDALSEGDIVEYVMQEGPRGAARRERARGRRRRQPPTRTQPCRPLRLSPVAVDDREPPPAAERLRRDAQHERRLAALVLVAVEAARRCRAQSRGSRPAAARSRRRRARPRSPARGRRRARRSRAGRRCRAGRARARPTAASRSCAPGCARARGSRARAERVDVALVDVAEHRESADRVAVERAVADRELALVAGGEHEPVLGVRDRHQDRAADPRLDVLLREPVVVARAEERAERRRDRRRRSAGCRPCASRCRGSRPSASASSMLCARRERARHRDAEHPLAARAPPPRDAR